MRYYINREIASKGKTLSEFKRIRSETIYNVVIGEMTILQQILLDNISQSDNQEVSSFLLKPIKNMMIEPKDHIEKTVLFPKHIELTIKFETDDIEFTEDDLKYILGKYKPNISFNDKSILITLNAKANYKRANGQLQIIIENGTKIDFTIFFG